MPELAEREFAGRLSSAVAALAGLISVAAAAERVPTPGANASVEEARRFFTEDPDAPMIVPKAYDVTIVEYLDYQCSACRATAEPLRQLLAKDKKIRVIFRDWVIFGDASGRAALVAIGSKYQGKYLEVHRALYAIKGAFTVDKIKAAEFGAGVDWDRLQKDITAHSSDIEDLLARNDEQAQILGLDGTPGFIIGSTQSFGGMTLDQLEESVKTAREGRQPGEARGR